MYLAELAAHAWDLARAIEHLDTLDPLPRKPGTRWCAGHDQTLQHRLSTRRTSRRPGLTTARLEWVAANFVRPETLAAANNRLIAYHQTTDLTRRWGRRQSRIRLRTPEPGDRGVGSGPGCRVPAAGWRVRR